MSEAWAEKALRLIETDKRVARALDGIAISLMTIILHPPKGCYGFLYAAFDGIAISLMTIILHPPKGCYGFLYAAFDADGLADYRVGHDFHAVARGLPEPTFAVSGDYDVFAAIQRGEITERRALLTGKLHLTGSMVQALRHMKALETITAVLGSVPCTT